MANNPITIMEETKLNFQAIYGRPMTSEERRLVSAYDERENLALKPGELYELGSDPQREKRLSELTEKLNL